MMRVKSCLLATIIVIPFLFIIPVRAEILVGIANPLSGITLNLGEQAEVGTQAAVDHLNEAGGVLGQEIIAISMDDACEPRALFPMW